MKLSQPMPELAVADVEAAQAYYRDKLGFDIAWLYPGGEVGAVTCGDCAIMFRRTEGALHPGAFWIFAEDVDAAYAEFKALGADIFEPIENKPWGLRQFALRDMNGNVFYIHHDVAE